MRIILTNHINDPSGRSCWAVKINPTPKDVCGEANITLDHPRHSGENMLSRCFNFTGVKKCRYNGVGLFKYFCLRKARGRYGLVSWLLHLFSRFSMHGWACINQFVFICLILDSLIFTECGVIV